MRAIQITMDEGLLQRLDDDEHARDVGRSALIRELLARYLAEQEERRIVEAYRRGYGAAPVATDEFSVEEERDPWPDP